MRQIRFEVSDIVELVITNYGFTIQNYLEVFLPKDARLLGKVSYSSRLINEYYYESNNFIDNIILPTISVDTNTYGPCIIKQYLDNPKLELPIEGCNHVWQNYVGLTQVYDYCTICDHKKHA